MREMISLIRKTSNEEDYLGKHSIINLSIIILSFILSSSGDLYYIILSHILMLTWISCGSFQLFSLHERKKTDFVWCISNYSANQMIFQLFSAAILQNIIYMPTIIILLLIHLKASITVAVVTGIVHFIFAIAIGAFMSALFRLKHVGIILDMLFFLFFYYNGLKWTEAELYRIISPIVQLYNVYIMDISNMLGLIAVTIVMCFFVWLKFCFSTKRISKVRICCFLLSIFLPVSVVLYEDVRNKVVMRSEYISVKVGQISLSYRGIDELEARHFAKILSDLDNEFYQNGITKSKLDQLIIQKYTAPIYLKERRIPFYIKGNAMHINIFSNGMINDKNPDLVIDMFLRMAVHIITNEDTELMEKRETYGLIYDTIYKVIQNDMKYTEKIKNYAKKIADIASAK